VQENLRLDPLRLNMRAILVVLSLSLKLSTDYFSDCCIRVTVLFRVSQSFIDLCNYGTRDGTPNKVGHRVKVIICIRPLG